MILLVCFYILLYFSYLHIGEIVSSASILKPFEDEENVFTNLRENTLYQLNISLTLFTFPNKNFAKEVIILFPKE